MLSLLEYFELRKRKTLFEVVQNISELLSEGKLAGSGPKGERHSRKYVQLVPEKGKEKEKVTVALEELRNEQKKNNGLDAVKAKTSPLVLKSDYTTPEGVVLKKGYFVVPHHRPNTKDVGQGKRTTKASNFVVYDKDGNLVKSSKDNISTNLPHTAIEAKTNLSYRYNYEMGIIRLYNHIAPKILKRRRAGEDLSPEDIRKIINGEIRNSLKPKANGKPHPLSFLAADEKDFAGGIPKVKDKKNRDKAIKSHNQSITDAADLVTSILTHPDFASNIDRGDKLEPTGKSTEAHMSKLFLKCYGVKNENELSPQSRTSKGDTRTNLQFVSKQNESLPKEHHKGANIEQKSVSLKKGSAQLTSNGPEDSEAILRAAANEYFGKKTHDDTYDEVPKTLDGKPLAMVDKEGHVTKNVSLTDTQKLLDERWPEDEKEKFKRASNLISHFRAHMESGMNLPGSDSMCLQILRNLDKNMARVGGVGEDKKEHPNYNKNNKAGFLRRMYEHAATGRYKFTDHVGTATHMGETGKAGKIRDMDHYFDAAEKSGQLKIADKAVGEEGEGDTSGIRVGKSKHPEDPHHSMRIGTPKSKLFEEEQPAPPAMEANWTQSHAKEVAARVPRIPVQQKKSRGKPAL